MSNKRSISDLIVAGIPVIIFTSCVTNSYPDIPRGPWLGQVLPDSGLHLFAPGIVSTDLSERDAAWNPNSREFYFSPAAG